MKHESLKYAMENYSLTCLIVSKNGTPKVEKTSCKIKQYIKYCLQVTSTSVTLSNYHIDDETKSMESRKFSNTMIIVTQYQQ